MAMSAEADNSKNDGLVFFGKGVRPFNLDELINSEAEVLGKGTFGSSYKVDLEGKGGVVAVIRLEAAGHVSEMEFKERVERLGELVHENLLPLKAYCWHIVERLLLCDYMPMGSLSALLHGGKGADKTLLSWKVRSRIAYEVARGIEYLHSRGPNFCHGNIRSSNVLLTSSYSAQISGFGIAQLVSPGSKSNLIPGYHAPEVTNTEKVSREADVYSFGVLLLEMLTGESSSGAISNKKGFDLPKWVRLLFQEKPIFDVFDNELPRNKKTEEEMVQMLQLAICCTFEYPNKRPSMAAVSNRIKEVCGVET
ncbi:probable inactive receptor kinase RLK902 [Cornus florida]|uniref:probable inactive receptor kinase RLK902 n=1 Tax=Cornus florida TaxID=4283 RepID=UPI002899B9D9|nr:probable inactive receptor kinase RLK902 [Cornus florida]